MPLRNLLQHDIHEKDMLRKVTPEAHYQRMMDRSSIGVTPVPRETVAVPIQVPDLKQIDLLKVDVKSRELDVLQGLDNFYWKLIHNHNAAVEVSDLSGLREDIDIFVKDEGFSGL